MQQNLTLDKKLRLLPIPFLEYKLCSNIFAHEFKLNDFFVKRDCTKSERKKMSMLSI